MDIRSFASYPQIAVKRLTNSGNGSPEEAPGWARFLMKEMHIFIQESREDRKQAAEDRKQAEKDRKDFARALVALAQVGKGIREDIRMIHHKLDKVILALRISGNGRAL